MFDALAQGSINNAPRSTSTPSRNPFAPRFKAHGRPIAPKKAKQRAKGSETASQPPGSQAAFSFNSLKTDLPRGWTQGAPTRGSTTQLSWSPTWTDNASRVCNNGQSGPGAPGNAVTRHTPLPQSDGRIITARLKVTMGSPIICRKRAIRRKCCLPWALPRRLPSHETSLGTVTQHAPQLRWPF